MLTSLGWGFVCVVTVSNLLTVSGQSKRSLKQVCAIHGQSSEAELSTKAEGEAHGYACVSAPYCEQVHGFKVVINLFEAFSS